MGFALTREKARATASMRNLGYSDLKSEGWNQSFYKYNIILEQLLANTHRMALQLPIKAFLHAHEISTLQVSPLGLDQIC